MFYEFRWNQWNIDKCDRHNVHWSEAEQVVRKARRPYPQRIGNDKFLAHGQTEAGDYLQVIYLIEEDDVVFVIHARPLRDNEKRLLRRRRQ